MTNSLPEIQIPQATQPLAAQSGANRNLVLTARGGGLVFAGRVVGQAVSFLFGLIIARYLGAYQFGLYRLSFNVVDTLSKFSLLGLHSAVMRYIPIARQREDRAFLWGIIQVGFIGPGLISLTLSFLLFLFADQVAVRLFNELALAPVLRLFSLNIPLLTLLVMGTYTIQGFKKVEYLYVRSIGGRLVNLVVVSFLLFAGLGLLGVVATQIISSTVALIFLIFFIHKLFPLNQPWSAAKRNTRELLGYSLPIYLADLLRDLGGKFEALVLGFFGMTVGVGVFSVASSLGGLSSVFHGSLGTIASPMFAELHDRKEYDQLKSVYHATTKWSVAFNLPFFLTIFFFGDHLLSIFGREFKAGTLSLIILGVGSFFNAFTGQSGSMINMIGESKVTAVNSVVYLAATLVVDFTLIPYWGIEGAALAAVLSGMTVNLLRMVQVYRLIHLWPFNWSILKPFGASIVAAAAGYAISHWLAQTSPFVEVPVGILVIWGTYSLATILLKLSPEDRLILSKLGRRLTAKKSRRE